MTRLTNCRLASLKVKPIAKVREFIRRSTAMNVTARKTSTTKLQLKTIQTVIKSIVEYHYATLVVYWKVAFQSTIRKIIAVQSVGDAPEQST